MHTVGVTDNLRLGSEGLPKPYDPLRSTYDRLPFVRCGRPYGFCTPLATIQSIISHDELGESHNRSRFAFTLECWSPKQRSDLDPSRREDRLQQPRSCWIPRGSFHYARNRNQSACVSILLFLKMVNRNQLCPMPSSIVVLGMNRSIRGSNKGMCDRQTLTSTVHNSGSEQT